MKMLDSTSYNSDLESVRSTPAHNERCLDKCQSNKRPSATNSKDVVQRPAKRKRTRIKCDLCNATFDTSEELQRHVCRNDVYFLGVAKKRVNQIPVSNVQSVPRSVNNQERVVHDDVTKIGDASPNISCDVKIKGEWLETSPGQGAADSGEYLKSL